MEAETAFLDYLPDESILEIMYEMDGDVLLKFCFTFNKRIISLCDDELFWKNKYQHDFPDEPLPAVLMGNSSKETYRRRFNATPTLAWNVSKATDATKNAYFILAKNGAHLVIGSAPRRWQL